MYAVLKTLIAPTFGLAMCASANAALITDLFSTGVDASGAALLPGVADPHYALTSQPTSGLSATTVLADGFPIPPWVANSSTSTWIGPGTDNAVGPGGLYTYETTFTVPALANLATVLVTGLYAVDNQAIDIVLNGTSVGAGQLSTGYNAFTPFTISSDFVLGLNTLEFVLRNAGTGPTGLRVDSIRGSYEEEGENTIPEPATLLLVGIAAAGLGIQRRRRN